jgi:hypothetical protein
LVHKPGSTATAVTSSGGSDGSNLVATNSSSSSLPISQQELVSNISQLSNSGIEKIKDSQFWISLEKFLIEQFPETDDANNVLKEFYNYYNKNLSININLEDLINKEK